MLQNFDNNAQPDQAASRMALVRLEMDKAGVDGFIVPREDEFMGEYVPACGERLKWLTGFGGSAGVAIILKNQAALFLDGRYTLEAENYIDTESLTIIPIMQVSIHSWLTENLNKGSNVAYDPKLHSISQIKKLSAGLDKQEITLTPLEENPIDMLWSERPAPPDGSIHPHTDIFAGQSSSDKRKDISAKLVAEQADALLITQPENSAWLLNIRGEDVPRTPFALSFCILKEDKSVAWFIDPDRLSSDLEAHLEDNVEIIRPEDMKTYLENMTGKVLVDPSHTPQYFKNILQDKVVEGKDPCNLKKACKNPVEIEGAKAAHIRDGAALCKFLHWLDITAPAGNVSEVDAVSYLEQCRQETGKLKDLSFDTISGSGPNGAIVHYRVNNESNRTLQAGELYLVDSGGQYLDGTTDVTRTVFINGASPPDMAIEAFTRVLKGHIALATARFPENTDGVALDALARAPLWAGGMDFDHGTGHGVGSYLSVHEGPQRISKGGTQPLMPGMIVSNEPGFYQKGEFGIRIENLQFVTPAVKINSGHRPMMGFEVLTLAPIDKRLINADMLVTQELEWLNNYHKQVLDTLSPLLEADTLSWLQQSCAPL